MASYEILNEKTLNIVDVKSRVSKLLKRDEDSASTRVKRLHEFLNEIKFPNKKEFEEKLKKIMNLNIPRLNETHVIKLIELKPVNEDEIKSILLGYRVTVSKENIKKIFDIVKE